MIEDNKLHLPFILNGITKKLHSLFLQKLILYDSEILQAKHLRHYDLECEGLLSLIHFLDRKINKNQLLAFQKLKSYRSNLSEVSQQAREQEQEEQLKKAYLKRAENMATPKAKFFTRANTTIEESDNSFIFSPNLKKNPKNGCKTEYFGSSIHVEDQRSDILQKLLNRVKKANNQACQESLQHAKSSYFNLTLGKQSLQTFQNNSNCDMSSPRYKKESKQRKRNQILQKFERIQQKIYEQPRIVLVSYMTPRAKMPRKITRPANMTYSVYEQQSFHQHPSQVVYVTKSNKKNLQNEYSGSGLSSSQSVTHINYARQVYL